MRDVGSTGHANRDGTRVAARACMRRRSIRARWGLLERAFLVAGLVCLAAAGGMVGYARVNDWLGAAELAELTAAEPA